MRNIIPFKKEVIFKTNISEITSISLENTLSLKNDTLSGDFIVSGEYKISDKSTSVDPFELKLPFEIIIDDKYDSSKATIDIDDFYYEIINNNVLSVSIDVLVDKLQEKPVIELEDLTEVTPVREILEIEEDNMDILKENIESKEEVKEVKEESIDKIEDIFLDTNRNDTVKVETEEVAKEKINSLFNQFSKDSEVYVTYNVFILRDGDTIDTILEKYNVTMEELKKYNDLSNLQLGDKIIIPCNNERN